ncbi:ribonuclease E/G [Tropicimonas sp. IMCC34011]|uniref:ribonuclease E/G n=1 Tax=Tropicimonas sp. IMCC34011 TaxID=2248759 RepID=UPI000E280AB6|nr:ribonuclease E/G [Tropicimonas sp. IMCC34011]
MKGTSVILGTLAGRAAAARMVDGVLDDLLIDGTDPVARPGAILRGIADRPMKGQGGIFLALPGGRRGFLKQAKGIAPGQPLQVQVTGHSEPGKAIPVTLRLLFKSRFAIVTPGAPGINISRAIRDEEARVALAEIAAEIDLPDGAGLILRSAAEGADEVEVAEDIHAMCALAADVLADDGSEPELLVDGPDAHAAAWRDWPVPDEVDDGPSAFADRGVLDAIAALAKACPLPGGGTLMVEETRALVACDVDTGGDTSPAAGLKANIAAVRALPRILRCLGLGGQVVVDLAPAPKRDRKSIEQSLRAALRADPVETTFVGWTTLGHLELTRKRERLPLPAEVMTEAA